MSCSQILQRKLSRIASHKTTQFVKVFSLKSFPLYGMKFCCSAVWRSMYEVASFSGPAQLSVACSTASFLGPAQLSVACSTSSDGKLGEACTASDGKLGRAWERGYVWSSSQFSCPPFSCTGCLPVLTSLQIAHNRLSTATDIEELVHCPKLRYILVVHFRRNSGSQSTAHNIMSHLPPNISYMYMYACRVSFYI